MKKTLITHLLVLVVLLISCNNDEIKNNNTITTQYSGVLVGSSGAYRLKFSETNSNATIIFDDVQYVLTSNETLKKGETLTLTDGTVTLTISTDSEGKNPSIKFNIPGHVITATIAEELASNPVQNYTGTATITKDNVINYKSTFNVTLLSDNSFQAIQKIITNGGVDEGKIDKVDGTYLRVNNVVVFTYSKDNQTIVLALNQFEKKLTGSQTDPEIGTTTIELTKM
jgi:hypothetical protein